jgi:uncharacterized membrane protein YraQ (UPF0718 family)
MFRSPEFAAWLRGASATFTTTLAGLAFETIPFLLMGTLLSAIIQTFVPDRALKRLFPKNRYLSILVALGVGVFVPICECGTVPLARRLRQKGLPLSTAVAFLLAAPLSNPMTIVSTYVAFKGTGDPVFALRLGFGLAAAFIIAVIVEVASRGRPWLDIADPSRLVGARRFSRVEAAAVPAPPRSPSPARKSRPGMAARIAETVEHASYDFLDTARYLIAGISIAALARAFVPAGAILRSLGKPITATGTGLLSAYVLSLCSSADAFVARSLFAPSSYYAVLAFLVLGPMIDLKNTVLLSRMVKPRLLAAFVILSFVVVGVLVLAASPLLEAL